MVNDKIGFLLILYNVYELKLKLMNVRDFFFAVRKDKWKFNVPTYLAFFGFLGSNGLVLSSSLSRLKSSPRSRGTNGVR